MRKAVTALLVLCFAAILPASVVAQCPIYLTQWGTLGAGPGQFDGPKGLAADAAGNVYYVADATNDRIQKFTSSGTYLTEWGTLGSGDGEFDNPSGVDVDAAGNVYVADSQNHRVQKFTSSGAFLAKWGTLGGGPGQFNVANDLTIDADGDVYVNDARNHRIQKFTSAGTYLTQWGSVGAGPGQFANNGAQGIATDPDGDVYVTDTFNDRVQKFNATGTYITQWAFTRANGVDVDAAGNVYVSDRGFTVRKFTGTGTLICQWGSSGNGDGELLNPFNIAVDAAGNVLVSEWGNHRIQKFGGVIDITPTFAEDCISTVTPCVTADVDISRTDSVDMRGFSVTFQLSSELELCDTVTPENSILEGTYLSAIGGTNYEVLDNGGGSYTVDAAILGLPCGQNAATGTLFTVDVTNSGADGTGTLTITGMVLRDCVNVPILAVVGGSDTITVDNTAPAALADLAAAQVKTGNDGDGTTGITLTFSGVEAQGTVEVFRKGYGDYPEYDGGSVPLTPATPAAALGDSWVSSSVTTSPGADETDSERDFMYFVAFVTDSCGNVSAVSNQTGGTLNYHLGDFVPLFGGPLPLGDNLVDGVDISKLGFHYGTEDGVDALYLDSLDVGPTGDLSVNDLPTTDDKIQFEDMIVVAINFGQVSKPGAPPAARNGLTVSVPESTPMGSTFEVALDLSSDGSVKGVSIPLVYDASVVAPVGYTAGELLGRQAGQAILLSPAPGTVDAAVFGSSFSGEGRLGTVQFRVIGTGNPGIELGDVQARDQDNQPVALDGVITTQGQDPTMPAFTGLLGASPNPFAAGTVVRFSLAEAGPAQVRIFGVDGRLVKTLLDGFQAAGEQAVSWDGRDDSGRTTAAGAYLIQFRSRSVQQAERIVRLR